jgi:predicted alpha/beta-fold hydrolase
MANTPPHSEFRPLPLLGNPHLQTFLGTCLFSSFQGRSQPRRVRLPDGDQLVLHDSAPARWRPGDAIAVLIHGLTGSHRANYIQRLSGLLLPRGVRVVRLDLRGAGHGFPLARRPYHAGCSDDLRLALDDIHRRSPASPLAVVGYSMGGNVALKLAGEASVDPVPGLAAVAAIGPPIDLLRCLTLITLPRNHIYEQHFVRNLVATARRRQRYFREPEPLRFPRDIRLPVYDDLYTAPRSGYASADDYYRRASALPLVPRIAVPTLILTARDDPFIAVDPFEELRGLKQVDVRILDHGGHLGFVGWDGAGGIYWAEQRIMEWIMRLLRTS